MDYSCLVGTIQSIDSYTIHCQYLFNHILRGEKKISSNKYFDCKILTTKKNHRKNIQKKTFEIKKHIEMIHTEMDLIFVFCPYIQFNIQSMIKMLNFLFMQKKKKNDDDEDENDGDHKKKF